MYVFPSLMTHLLSNMFMDPSSTRESHQILLNQWASESLERFHQLKLEMLLALEGRTIGLTLKMSGTAHPDS